MSEQPQMNEMLRNSKVFLVCKLELGLINTCPSNKPSTVTPLRTSAEQDRQPPHLVSPAPSSNRPGPLNDSVSRDCGKDQFIEDKELLSGTWDDQDSQKSGKMQEKLAVKWNFVLNISSVPPNFRLHGAALLPQFVATI